MSSSATGIATPCLASSLSGLIFITGSEFLVAEVWFRPGDGDRRLPLRPIVRRDLVLRVSLCEQRILRTVTLYFEGYC